MKYKLDAIKEIANTIYTQIRSNLPKGNFILFAKIGSNFSQYINIYRFYQKESINSSDIINNINKYMLNHIDKVRSCFESDTDYLSNDVLTSNELLNFRCAVDTYFSGHNLLPRNQCGQNFLKITFDLLCKIKFYHSLLIKKQFLSYDKTHSSMLRLNTPLQNEQKYKQDFILGMHLENMLFVGETIHFKYIRLNNAENKPIKGAFIFFSDRDRYDEPDYIDDRIKLDENKVLIESENFCNTNNNGN